MDKGAWWAEVKRLTVKGFFFNAYQTLLSDMPIGRKREETQGVGLEMKGLNEIT